MAGIMDNWSNGWGNIGESRRDDISIGRKTKDEHRRCDISLAKYRRENWMAG